MPKGPQGQKRPADLIGCAVNVAQVATGEKEDTSYASQNRRKGGVAGAEARMRKLSASERSKIATKAAQARWEKENDMIEKQQSPKSKLAAIYAAKKEAGLVDVKFLVGSRDEASFDDVANEVLRLEEAIKRKEYRVIRFNDKH